MRNGTRGQAKEVDRRVGGGWRPAQLSRHKRQGQKRAGQMTEKREKEKDGDVLIDYGLKSSVYFFSFYYYFNARLKRAWV